MGFRVGAQTTSLFNQKILHRAHARACSKYKDNTVNGLSISAGEVYVG